MLFKNTLMVALTFIISSSLYSQESEVNFEISPNTGFMDGSGLFGADVAMNYKAINLEFSAAQVIGETADLYPMFVNLVFNFASAGKIIPFGLVGTGLMLTIPSSLGSRSVSTLGMNFGGGVRYYITKDLGIRLGVSQYLTTIENKRDNFDELLIFQEVTIGVIFVY